jgi:hypothetical protein
MNVLKLELSARPTVLALGRGRATGMLRNSALLTDASSSPLGAHVAAAKR